MLMVPVVAHPVKAIAPTIRGDDEQGGGDSDEDAVLAAGVVGTGGVVVWFHGIKGGRGDGRF